MFRTPILVCWIALAMIAASPLSLPAADLESPRPPTFVADLEGQPIRSLTAKDFEPGEPIIAPSACFGGSCVEGDADGAVLVLRDPLLRVVFDDVAEGLTYTGDWMLEINGMQGADISRFSVVDLDNSFRPFTLAAGAPDHSLYVRDNGNVGLGTSTPDSRLDAEGDSTINVRLTTASASDFSSLLLQRAQGTVSAPTALVNNNILGAIQFRGYTGSAYSGTVAEIDVRAEENWTTTANGTRMLFQTALNGTSTPLTRMVIKNNGRVGIGTTSPQDMLEVNGGNIRVTGGSFIDDGTTLNAPDYVFEPGYELPTLDEVAAFIDANKHLPNVPSAADIKENGLNLSQFQMRLLEKVEELTLYTIDQQDQIKAQRDQIKAQQKLMDQLEERLARLEGQQ